MKIFLKFLIILTAVYLFILKPFYDFSGFYPNLVPSEFSYIPFKGYTYQNKKVYATRDCYGDVCTRGTYFTSWVYSGDLSEEDCKNIGGKNLISGYPLPDDYYNGFCEVVIK